MAKQDAKRNLRDRKVPLTAAQIRAAAASADVLNLNLATFVQLLANDEFEGTISIDGGRQLGECLANLHTLVSGLNGIYQGAKTGGPGVTAGIPESVPESEANTRKSSGNRRGFSESPKDSKSPKQP